jgi:hypothetical protein
MYYKLFSAKTEILEKNLLNYTSNNKTINKILSKSIINGETSMMRGQIFKIGLSPLPQKPIQLNRKCLHSLLLQILLHFLHCNNSTRANLYLIHSICYFFLVMYLFLQFLTILENTLVIEHLRYSIIGIHSQFMNVNEVT